MLAFDTTSIGHLVRIVAELPVVDVKLQRFYLFRLVNSVTCYERSDGRSVAQKVGDNAHRLRAPQWSRFSPTRINSTCADH
jgi:hypothetical protein